MVCQEHWPEGNHRYYYSMTLMILQYLIPLVVLVVTYTSIAIVVWGKRTPGEAENCRDQRMARSKRKVRPFMFLVTYYFTRNLISLFFCTDKSGATTTHLIELQNPSSMVERLPRTSGYTTDQSDAMYSLTSRLLFELMPIACPRNLLSVTLPPNVPTILSIFYSFVFLRRRNFNFTKTL